MNDNTQKLLETGYSQVCEAKDTVLKGIVEKIEGRAARMSDAEALTLVTHAPSYPKQRDTVFYHGVCVGDIVVDSVEMVVKFTPTVNG